jgi:ATP-dependent helicase/nuclease subunit A
MNTRADANDAKNPANSVWVSANAGAGKTHLLADRVTRLLLGGADPAQILCLTYTKAAAAEMSTRLFDRLGMWALLDDTELRNRLEEIGAKESNAESMRRARRLFAQALETPGGLKIQTIHSFCQHVLARFPVEARVPARFTVLDDRSASDLMRMSREAVLRRAAQDDETLAHPVAVLATRAADGRFAEIVDKAIGNAGRLREILAQHGNEKKRFFACLRKTLNVEPGDDEGDVLERFCAELRAERTALQRITTWLEDGSSSDRRQGGYMSAFLSDISPDNFEQLRRVFLTLNGEPRKTLATKKTAKSQPELFGQFGQLRDRVLAADERAKAAATATLTEAIVTVATSTLEEYAVRKSARAALDYDDLIHSTRQLLEREGAAAWVLYKLDGGINHILVDEAQDTSPEQWRIIAKLAEEFYSGLGSGEGRHVRTLFAVGDEKQSIFSFQGAAPEEFGRNFRYFRTRAENAELNFSGVRLPVSRRSAKSILSFVDAVFSDDEVRDGLSSTGETPLHEPHRSDTGRVEIWPTVKSPPTNERDPWNLPVDAPSPQGADIALAGRIADRIAHWLENGTPLPGVKDARAIVPGDIMILVRRRNAFAQEMIRQLMERKIPVAGADRMVLLDQIAIADLIALGRFVLLPEDELNLAALLKSPLIGLGEGELYVLAQPREEHLWDELSKRKHENDAFANAHAFLANALSQADYLPPFEFYANTLSSGVRKRMLARFGAEADDAIAEFLSLTQRYEDSYPPSLEGFLDWFSRGAAEVKRDMDQGGGAVRVMTVHGAKGLEAKIVIVPDTAQIPDHERRAGILYTDDCLFFGMPKSYETPPVVQAKVAAQLREMQEYRRLLYVALTRARDWLILCGYETKQGVHESAWYPYLHAAGKRIGKEERDSGDESVFFVGARIATERSARKQHIESKGQKPLPRFLSALPSESPIERPILRPSDAIVGDEPAPMSPLTDNSARRFRRGLLIHALLAMLPSVPRAERTAAGRLYLSSRGVAEEEKGKLLDEVNHVLDDPDFSSLFDENSRGEITITAELPELGPGVRISGQIDRLALNNDEIMIADFKTNRPPPESIEKTPAIYRAQLALYRAALSKIYPGRHIACVLVWTDGARAMRLPDSLLDEAFRKIRDRQTSRNMV